MKITVITALNGQYFQYEYRNLYIMFAQAAEL